MEQIVGPTTCLASTYKYTQKFINKSTYNLNFSTIYKELYENNDNYFSNTGIFFHFYSFFIIATRYTTDLLKNTVNKLELSWAKLSLAQV